MMKLRNKLDELEKMEGITEKEKGDTTFLNIVTLEYNCHCLL